MRYRSSRRHCLVLPVLALAVVVVFARAQVVAGAKEVLATLLPAAPSPVKILVLVDGSPGSPGAVPAIVREEVLTVALWLLSRPGEVQVWTTVDDPRAAVLVGRFIATGPARGARPAREAQARSDRARAASFAQHLALPLVRGSSLAEGLSRVALELSPGTILVFLTDGLQESTVARTECTNVSTPLWLRSLDQHQLLQPGSLRGVMVGFVRFAPGPIAGDRCSSSLQTYLRARDRWQSALTRAGATALFVPGGLTPEFLARSNGGN